MNSSRKDDLKTLEQSRPYIRSLLALLIYLRFGQMRGEPQVAALGVLPNLDLVYETADEFLKRLQKDVENS